MPWRNMSGSTTAQVFPETFAFGRPAQMRSRPVWVRAFLKSNSSTSGRSSRTQPLALKFGGNADVRIAHTESGHLVGLNIGGPDCAENLVPMFGLTNRDTYRALERNLNTRAKFASSPVVLINIDYPVIGIDGVDQDPRIPTNFKIWYFPNMTNLAQAIPMAPVLREVANARGNSVRYDIAGADIERRQFLVELRKKTLRENWHIEQLGGVAGDWALRGYLPDIANRPYGFVDRLYYSPEYAGTAKMILPRWDKCDIGPGKEFVEGQRINIFYANCYTQSDEKKGECWSDAGDDPIQTVLTRMGTDDGIQIDHIHPKALMGPNIYSNAQVLSSKLNRSKGRG